MDTPVLDIAYLRSITDGDAMMEREFFRLFKKTSDRCLSLLNQSIEQNDDALWEAASHELKGAAGYLGARRVQEHCQRARTVTASERAALLEALRAEVASLDQFITQLRQAS